MPDNTWRITGARRRHQFSFLLLLVLLLSQVLVLRGGCASHRESQADCSAHHSCGTSLAMPCSVTDCCQSAMRIPPTADSQIALRCIRDATNSSTLLLTVPSSNSDPEDFSSPSPPLLLFLRASALRI